MGGLKMVEYRVNLLSKICSYSPSIDTIKLGMPQWEHLTDSELMEFISDAIIHEYTHKLLCDMFTNKVSRLFDLIGYHFENLQLHEKVLQGTFQCTYLQFKDRYGFEELLNRIHVSDSDILEAKNICNNRGA